MNWLKAPWDRSFTLLCGPWVRMFSRHESVKSLRHRPLTWNHQTIKGHPDHQEHRHIHWHCYWGFCHHPRTVLIHIELRGLKAHTRWHFCACSSKKLSISGKWGLRRSCLSHIHSVKDGPKDWRPWQRGNPSSHSSPRASKTVFYSFHLALSLLSCILFHLIQPFWAGS